MPETASVRRKRLHHRSRYRSFLENDLVFGRFAQMYLDTLGPNDLGRYEALLAEGDHDLFAWISGREPVPAIHDHHVFSLLRRIRIALGRAEDPVSQP